MILNLRSLVTLISFITLWEACSQRPSRWQSKQSDDATAISPEPSEEEIDPSLDPDDPNSSATAIGETGNLMTSGPGLDVVWKRYRAFEHGMVTALDLKKDNFCLELGKQSCVDKTHLSFLGGNEPYQSGTYERAQSPTVLTAVAVDRIVLTACAQRLEMDRTAAAGAVVFKHFPLTGTAPTAKQIEAQAIELYRRFLARDPDAAELTAIDAIGTKSLTSDKLALMMCYAIGSNVENILL